MRLFRRTSTTRILREIQIVNPLIAVTMILVGGYFLKFYIFDGGLIINNKMLEIEGLLETTLSWVSVVLGTLLLMRTAKSSTAIFDKNTGLFTFRELGILGRETIEYRLNEMNKIDILKNYGRHRWSLIVSFRDKETTNPIIEISSSSRQKRWKEIADDLNLFLEVKEQPQD